MAIEFHPALRIVDQAGNVTAGPYNLWQPYGTSLDLVVRSTACHYARIGQDWETFSFAERSRLYGFRPSIVLAFSWLGSGTDSNKGLLVMRNLYTISVAAEDYAAMQFNLFADSGASPWRGVLVRSDWAPRITERQKIGFELDLELVAKDLIPAAGDWMNLTW
jgi:hypothetical protein